MRDFGRSPEPRARVRRSRRGGLRFVVQKHAASRLHYDFRLEHDGVLKSWAVPKGPSLDPEEKRLAVRVEDHPVDYGDFEGVIPEGDYGGGAVLLWDQGIWSADDGDPEQALREGRLVFQLEGSKLRGGWILVRMRSRGSADAKNWLLIKRRDEEAREGEDAEIADVRPESVASGRAIEAIAAAPERTWRSNRGETSRRRPPLRSRSAAFPGGASIARKGPRAKIPDFVEPELATLVAEAPHGDDWIHEIKYDGYRMQARLDGGRARWLSRNGLDWTDRFVSLGAAIEGLSAERALLDGELVALLPDGTSSFQELQNALHGSSALCYFAFDLLHLDGRDLRALPLTERKRALEQLLAGAPAKGPLRFSRHVAGNGPSFFAAACRSRLEGIVSKRSDAPYRSGRTRDWVKTKCSSRQEFVVAGFTEPKGSRASVGALVLGVYAEERLRHVGRVGTGFDQATLRELRRRLEALRVEKAPFRETLSPAARRGVSWVRPELVVEVAFTGWTADGLLRHPTFEGMREDKPARSVIREEPAAHPRSRGGRRPRKIPSSSSSADVSVAGVALTHPDRVLYRDQRLTKLELARFYERIAPRILPHVESRPLAVVRCPRGEGGGCFFQKHAHDAFPEGVRSVEVEESSGKSRYLMIDSVAGLVALVQMGALEIHPWGSRAGMLDRPDRMFFDLDPGPRVPWRRVVEAARRLREILEGLELASFVKTTGGKGLHVVVPLAPKNGWDEVKAFSRAVALHLVEEEPSGYVATASKAQRDGRIFVDYLRNARGATAVAPYSTRARKGAPVSTPIAWDELDADLRSDAFTVANLEGRLARRRRDPWADFARRPQTLGHAMRALARSSTPRKSS